MKNLITIFSAFIISILSSKAQECTSYFKFSKGQKIELQLLDAKDKPTNLLKYEVLDFKPVNGGFSLVFDTQTFDAKGTLLAKGQSVGKCLNGSYMTDIRNISSDMIPKAADIRMDIEGSQMIYPAKMNVGDKLPDAEFSIVTSLATGMKLMTIKAKIENRTVETNETVETPAGKFDCLKITYTMTVNMMGTRTMQIEEYLSKGTGVVKQVTKDSKGKTKSTLILSKLS